MTFAATHAPALIPVSTGPAAGRVLVLDTDADRQALLADVVGRAGSEVTFATSGVEAMERLATRRPEIVLVAGLEDGSARGFLSWARPRYPEVALVALAGSIEDATELYNLGADIVETMPLDPDRLGAKLGAAMRRLPAHAPVIPVAEGAPALATQAA